MAIISPTTIETITTAIDCFSADCLSGHDIFLNSAFTPLKKRKRVFLSVSAIPVTSKIHNACLSGYQKIPSGLFGFLVHGMGLAESAILLGFHSVRMGLLILGCIVVTLLAFCTCQCYFCTHLSTSTYSLSSNFKHKKKSQNSSRLSNITQKRFRVNYFCDTNRVLFYRIGQGFLFLLPAQHTRPACRSLPAPAFPP